MMNNSFNNKDTVLKPPPVMRGDSKSTTHLIQLFNYIEYVLNLLCDKKRGGK